MFYCLYWLIVVVDVCLCFLDLFYKWKIIGCEKEKWIDFDVVDIELFVELGILGVISFFVLYICF